MNDWKHVDDWQLQGGVKDCINWASKKKCIGRVFKYFMFESLAFGYDCAVNFIEAHE